MTCLQAVLICRLFYLFELTPIISDPEYLLDQHIPICVKSTDADESYGEGCVALRAAQICYTEFQITLTHHGEKTGTLTGGIQLQTSEVKPTEKLYDFIKVERDDTVTSRGRGNDFNKCSVTQAHDISNPNYMGMSFQREVIDKGWSYSMPPKSLPQGCKDSKKGGYDVGTRSPTVKAANPTGEGEKSEMFDNPLYGSMGKGHGRGKDQDHQPRDHLTPVDQNFKTADGETERPPVPTPRNRSFTYSETKPQPPTPVTSHPSMQKKPVVPSHSEGGGSSMPRPPLPSKYRAEPPVTKPRDYRDSSELPIKQRLPARPGQPLPHQRHAS